MQVTSRVKDEVTLQKDASGLSAEPVSVSAHDGSLKNLKDLKGSAQPEAEVEYGKAVRGSAENEGKHKKTISFQLPALIFLVSVFLAAVSW